MPSLLGNKPNQVPTNGDLGTLAFQDSNAVNISGGTIIASGAFSANGGATLGDASGDALTINSSAVSIPNGLNFDSNTFVIDATNNRVGIGTASPSTALTVAGDVALTGDNNIDIAVTTTGSAKVGRTDRAYVQFTRNDFDGILSFHTTTNGSAGLGERMRITDTGNVGIGTSSPDSYNSAADNLVVGTTSGSNGITIAAGSASQASIFFADGTATGAEQAAGYLYYFHPTDSMVLGTSNTERMRITSTGNVAIGVSSSNFKTTIQGNENTGDPANPAQLSIESATAYNSTPVSGIVFRNKYNSGGSYAGMGGIIVGKSNATDGDYASYLALTTRANGANVTERMRLDSSGNLGLGVTPSAWGSNFRAIELNGGAFWSDNTSGGANVNLFKNTIAANGYTYTYESTGNALGYIQNNTGHLWVTAPSGTAGNAITFTQAMTLDASGNLGIGTTSPAALGSSLTELTVKATAADKYANLNLIGVRDIGGNQNGVVSFWNNFGTLTRTAWIAGHNTAGSNTSGELLFATASSGTLEERMRIDSSGIVMVGTSSGSLTTAGLKLRGDLHLAVFNRSSGNPLYINRLTDDGSLVDFAQDGTTEGSISVSGTTVSYNGGHLARWSQLLDGSKDDTLLKGTVLTNLDEMCVWTKDGEQLENEQLNKMKVSDVEGDTNVAGVFVNWTRDEDCNSDDMNIAMTGDMIIRVAQGVTVNRGDLLMSAGDGTAKPQGDDIVRSKTIAKVTSTNITCTYADGSYCVPCVLMAC